MSEYILILVWIGFVALLANQFNLKREEIVCGERVQRFMPWFAFFAFAPIMWMAGNRKYIGDTWSYVRTFLAMPDSFSQLPSYIVTIKKDVGFYTFVAILKQFIGNNSELYLLIIASIHGIILSWFFRKYSYNYLISVFLFLASTDYISWMFNGIRQFTAVVIAIAATPFIFKKKYVLAVLVVLFASLFHQSALIVIPLMLIANGEAWNKKTMSFMAVILLAITFVGQFTNLLDTALSETQYVNVVSDYTSFEDDGTNPLRVAVYCVPALLAFLGRKHIRIQDNKLLDFCTNMSIMSAGLYLMSMVTSGIFLGRLPIYCSLYGYILLPWEMEELFAQNSKKVVYGGMVGLYLMFYYYQMHSTYGMI